MKRFCSLPVYFLIASCALQTTQLPTVQTSQLPHVQATQLPTVQAAQKPTVQATQAPTHTSIPDSIATLVAASPSLEVTFDGSKCVIPKPAKINAGERVLLLQNLSGHRSFLIVGRLYPEKSLEDFLQWFEVNCGPPGSICERTGEAPWISWLFEVNSMGQDSAESRYRYRLNLEGQYLLAVTRSDGSVWPCGALK